MPSEHDQPIRCSHEQTGQIIRMRNPRTRRAHRGVLISCCMVWWLWGCSPESLDPTSVPGGSWLDTPGSISCNEELARSPDGAWLAFWMTSGDFAAGASPRYALGLVDWSAGTTRVPDGVPADVSLIPSSLCWSDDAGRLHVSGHRAGEFTTRHWFRLDLDGGGGLIADGPPPQNCRVTTNQQWVWHRPSTHVSEIEQGLEVTNPGEREVILRVNGRELARHRTRQPLADQILVIRFAWSPDRRWLAYLLSEGRWGLSAGAPRVYRVARNGGEAAKLLGTGAYTLHWQRPGELLACTRRGGSRDFGVARWRVD